MRNKIIVEDIINLHTQGLNNKEIAVALNYDQHTVGTHLKINNLRFNKDSENLTLSDIQKSVLVGTLLGDSSLTFAGNCKYPKLSFTHSINQLEYFEFKRSYFSSIELKSSPYKSFGESFGATRESICFGSKALMDLMPYYFSFYKEDGKIIPRLLLEESYSAISFAFHIMDDGCRDRKSIRLSTECFSNDDQDWLIDFYKRKFDVTFTRIKARTYFVLRSSYLSSEILRELIEPYFCDSMKYKLPY